MNYRSYSDLERCVAANLDQVPSDVDLIVGIPRSGLFVANLLSLHLNLPLADLTGFLAGRMLARGKLHGSRPLPATVGDCRRVLVVDDSVGTGATLERARRDVKRAHVAQEVLWAAIYVTSEMVASVDLAFEVCPHPRFFAWSIMRHRDLAQLCLDIDGVLCRNPTREEDDDGDRYLAFLETVRPLALPRRPVGALVTCRLERYRAPTEEWLRRQGVRYERLIMLDLADRAARKVARGEGRFKAEAYRETDARLFVESGRELAAEIAEISGRPVLCWTTQVLVPGRGGEGGTRSLPPPPA